MTGAPPKAGGWALRAADQILTAVYGPEGPGLPPRDRERFRRILARIMVRERLTGLARGSPGPAWTYAGACGETPCPECGLTYREHPRDPDEGHLTLTCAQGRVKL